MPTHVSRRWLWLAAVLALPACTSLWEWTSRTILPSSGAQVVGRITARGNKPAPRRAVVFVKPLGERRTDGTPEAVLIRQRHGRFEPDFAVAAIGQPVRFSNQDRIFHGVFSYSRPNQFEEPPFAPGQVRTVTFSRSGVVELYSPVDSAMRAMIVVVPDHHHAIPNARGDYRLTDLPAGRYRLSAWADAYQVTTREIELSRGEVEHAELELRRAVRRTPPDLD